MKKPDTFPCEHKANGMVFQIYLAPLFKTAKAGEKTRYDSFLVMHQEGGRRVQKRRSRTGMTSRLTSRTSWSLAGKTTLSAWN